MHILVCFILGMLVSLAVKRKNGPDVLGHWRFVAGALGACLPHAEWLLWLWREGVFLQARHALLWSLPVMPLLALAAAATLAVLSGRHWWKLYVPLASALAASVLMAIFTAEGVLPLYPLLDLHLALAMAHPLDGIVLLIGIITLATVWMFPSFKRDLARGGLGVLLVYMVALAIWAQHARAFGAEYAVAIAPNAKVQVSVIPQPLSAFNWQVVVQEQTGENAGRLHLTHINLQRKSVSKPGRGAAYAAYVHNRYMPLDSAVWQIFWQYGPPDMPLIDAVQNKLQYQALRSGPFGRHARFAVWQNAVNIEQAKGVACGVFTDARFISNPPARGVFVVCLPAEGRHQPRFFIPRGKTYTELLPSLTVTTTKDV
jgi:hypothetical protein